MDLASEAKSPRPKAAARWRAMLLAKCVHSPELTPMIAFPVSYRAIPAQLVPLQARKVSRRLAQCESPGHEIFPSGKRQSFVVGRGVGVHHRLD